MDRRQDLEIILRSRTPLIVIETRDERRVLRMLQTISMQLSTDDYLPLFRWTVTDGLQRLDIDLAPQLMNSEPVDVLKHIRAVSKPGIYVLLDFHPFLDDPVHVRLIKDVCIHYRDVPRQLILISHQVTLPQELEAFSARVDMALPGEAERKAIIESVAKDYSSEHAGTQHFHHLYLYLRSKQLLPLFFGRYLFQKLGFPSLRQIHPSLASGNP